MTYQQKALPKLPQNWAWSEIGDLCDVQTGPFGTQLHKTDYAPSGIQVIEIGDVHPNRNLAEGAAHFVSKGKAKQLTRYEVRSGDILFTRVGTVGRCTKVPSACNDWLMSTSLIRVRPKIEDQVLSSFLLYYFWSPIAQSFAKASSKGTTREGTNSTIVEKLPLALAPVNEQKRIVSKVEELFSFLDTGAESLHKVQAQLKRYRQAVLKYAFEGKLTEEWRRANKGKLESAQRLLDKIRKDKMDFEKGKYKETPLSEITTLSKLPDLWVWTILGNIISVHSGEGLTKNKMKQDGDYPVYGGNGVSGYYTKYLLEESKIIIGRVGAKCGVIHITPPKSWVTDNALIVNSWNIDLKFLYYSLGILDLNRFSVSTAQPVISSTKIYPLLFKLPPLQEQKKIVDEIEFRLSVSDEIGKTISQNLKKGAKLRQSILKKAFEGKLVSQNQNDEPAEKLLARIKSESSIDRKNKFSNKLELSHYVK